MPSNGLSPSVKKLAVEIFQEMDTDGNKCIDMNETLKFWGNHFAKISSQAMFNAVDIDRNQKIDLKEWIKFWEKVKKSGHSEEDIHEELLNLKNRGTWVQFVGVKPLNNRNVD